MCIWELASAQCLRVWLHCVLLCLLALWNLWCSLNSLGHPHSTFSLMSDVFVELFWNWREADPASWWVSEQANEGTGGRADSLCRSASYLGLRDRLGDSSCVHLVPNSIPPSDRLNSAMLGSLTTSRDIPQSQMAEARAQLSGQLRQKKIIICPIVQMSSLDRPERWDNCVVLHFHSIICQKWAI